MAAGNRSSFRAINSAMFAVMPRLSISADPRSMRRAAARKAAAFRRCSARKNCSMKNGLPAVRSRRPVGELRATSASSRCTVSATRTHTSSRFKPQARGSAPRRALSRSSSQHARADGSVHFSCSIGSDHQQVPVSGRRSNAPSAWSVAGSAHCRSSRKMTSGWSAVQRPRETWPG